jgi:hypothetical protein
MDFWVILYSLVCVVVGAGTATFLFKRGQSIASMISLVLLILVFVFYGLRWFPGGNLNGSRPTGGVWPPIVNMCPDFMASWVDPSTRDVYCYDAAGIYSATGGASLVGTNIPATLAVNGKVGVAGYLLQKPTGTDAATKNPLQTIFKSPSSITTGSLLRWEGVWDGRSANSAKIPAI